MQKDLSTSTLTKECSEWAETFAEPFLEDPSLRFYAFKPALGTQASFLGDFTDKNGNFFSPIPAWQWHIAVHKNGKLHDEIHPNGAEVADYLNFFRWRDSIDYSSHKDFLSAVAWANGGTHPT